MTPTLPERLRAANKVVLSDRIARLERLSDGGQHMRIPGPSAGEAWELAQELKDIAALLREAADAIEQLYVLQVVDRHISRILTDAPPTDAAGGGDRDEMDSIYRSHKRAVESDIADEDGDQ